MKMHSELKELVEERIERTHLESLLQRAVETRNRPTIEAAIETVSKVRPRPRRAAPCRTNRDQRERAPWAD